MSLCFVPLYLLPLALCLLLSCYLTGQCPRVWSRFFPVPGCLGLVLTKLLLSPLCPRLGSAEDTHLPHPLPMLRLSWEMDAGHGEIWSRKHWAARSPTCQMFELPPHHTADCGEGCVSQDSPTALPSDLPIAFINTEESRSQLMTKGYRDHHPLGGYN